MAEPRPLSTSVLARLWIAATAVWGAKWTAHCGELPIDDDGALTIAGGLWANGLAGFSEARILATLERFTLTGADWPPNLPQLRKACLGIPSFEAVKGDIGPRTLRFTRMVWQYLDHWAFTRADQRDAERQLRSAYDHAVERRMCGDSLPSDPAGEIEHQVQPVVPASPETAQTHFDACRELLNGRAYADPGIEVGATTHPPREVPLSQVEKDLAAHYAGKGFAITGDEE